MTCSASPHRACPAGSPGMDYGQAKQRYQVIGLTREGRDRVLGEYQGDQLQR